MKLKKLVALPLALALACPAAIGGALTVGTVAIAATALSGCASPAQRAEGRQDARIESRTKDRYEHRRD